MPHTPTPDISARGFLRFDLMPSLQRAIIEAAFVEPRPIQAETIPAALEGRDVLGLAQTGTGKTAAFALPILERLQRTNRAGHGAGHSGHGAGHSSSPRALIIAPTRELANQIEAEFRLLAQFTRVKITTIYGGVSMHHQVIALRKLPEIVVACPGRLLDLMEQKVLRLDAVETLVLDEADHMFDMGFLPDLKRILAAVPAKRQNLLFSATMPREIRELADKILRNPHVVELSHSKPPETIEHSLFPVDESRKLELLKHLLGKDRSATAIVFTRTKHRARRIAEQLLHDHYKAIALQGNMSQSQRDRAMRGFRSGEYDILVATDIAARGIDVANITYVINYDMPMSADAYTHRIGRTGRAERKGQGFSLMTSEDSGIVRDIERKLGVPIPRVRVEGFQTASAPRAAAAPSGAHQRKGGGAPPLHKHAAPSSHAHRDRAADPGAPGARRRSGTRLQKRRGFSARRRSGR